LRVGIFGGTFDPPHVGHVLTAGDACETLALDRLIFVPAASQPFKVNAPAVASPKDRLAMVRLAIGGDARFEVSDIEIERGGLSYTVETLEALALSRPGAKLFLILGIDALTSFERWRSPQRIRELATIAVLIRGESDFHESESRAGAVVRVSSRRIDVSSSEIRRRLREGKPITAFVAESVERYIATANLYRSDSPDA
jgi:nicotinate-nucleotide adenylyltransferase